MSEVDVIDALRSLDRRVRVLELALIKQKPPKLPPGAKRPRGRPKGSRSRPQVQIAEPLFSEHDLDPTELLCQSTLEGWVRLSARCRPANLSQRVDDAEAWTPPLWGRDLATKSWASLCTLRAYVVSRGELLALKEALRLVEHLPIDNPELMRRGLGLVEESLQLRLPPRFSSAA
jgi:hypothetical protein